MSDLDSKLTEILNADMPPARDAKFRVDVLLRMERARFRRRLIRMLAVAIVAASVVALNATRLEAWITADIWRLVIVALGAGAAVFSLSGIPIEAVPGVRGFARTLGRWLNP